ncbi:MAG: polyisoprenoid-binding protein [Nitrospinae bacterium]|nr:polyisoprenoid-binding protein [Nitrospinota bacterium]
MRRIVYIVISAFAMFSTRALAADYVIDKAHTNIGFSVKHMVISNVKGNFTDFSGVFSFDEKGKKLTKAEAVIKAGSVFTNEPKRDDDLRSPNFFDVAIYPNITFKLVGAKSLGGDKMRAVGDLTIHGVTKRVTLDGEFLGTAKDPMGDLRAGFTAHTVVNRKDFGLNWNKVLDNGGVLVGDEVKLLVEVEGVLLKPGESGVKNPCAPANPCGPATAPKNPCSM